MTPDREKQLWTNVGEEAHARCDTCGFGWKMQRGDRFRCPYCGNEPEDVLLGRAGSFVMLMDEQPEWSAWKR